MKTIHHTSGEKGFPKKYTGRCFYTYEGNVQEIFYIAGISAVESEKEFWESLYAIFNSVTEEEILAHILAGK